MNYQEADRRIHRAGHLDGPKNANADGKTPGRAGDLHSEPLNVIPLGTAGGGGPA